MFLPPLYCINREIYRSTLLGTNHIGSTSYLSYAANQPNWYYPGRLEQARIPERQLGSTLIAHGDPVYAKEHWRIDIDFASVFSLCG